MKPRVLLVVEQCNPRWSSVPSEGFHYACELSQLVDVMLVTHERNAPGLTGMFDPARITYIPEPRSIRRYYSVASRLAVRGADINWPLLHLLSYPVYAHFDASVKARFGDAVAAGRYDVVHAFTPIVPRYPVGIADACGRTPFVIGPVNGGLTYPRGFEDIARREHNRFNSLRGLSHLLPGYRRTYERANRVLVGSTYTLRLLQRTFEFQPGRAVLFYENGVPSEFLTSTSTSKPARPTGPLRVLFVGRLVPLKCVDLIIEAFSRLDLQQGGGPHLEIVGDGPERPALQRLAERLGVCDRVTFAGWVPHADLPAAYSRADVFCFPSIREFGGAVVLEAMGAGLPCVISDSGAMAEYVTDEIGFRIAPTSRQALLESTHDRLRLLLGDASLRQRMSRAAVARAAEFEWSHKAAQLVHIYDQVIDEMRQIALAA